MKRRELLRNILLISAGASLVPSCARDEKTSSLQLKNLQISKDQEETLAALAETIIPQTESPGAKALGSHLFILMMVDECRTLKDQQTFIRGLDQFMALSKQRMGTSFQDATQAQKTTLVEDIEKKNNVPEELVAFYGMTKRLTIQSFTTSQYFLTRVQVYEMVPGRFHGCFPIKNNSIHG